MQPAKRRRTRGSLFVVLLVAAAARATPVVALDDPIPSPTDPIPDTVSDATDPIPDTVSDATDPIPDTVSDATDPIPDTVSDATDPIPGTASSGPATAATGARGTSQAGTRGHTSSREAPTAAEDGGLRGAVEQILGFLAQTGLTVLPWIVAAIALTVLGILLLRLSKRGTART
jgi:hypothetical protein